MVFSLPTSFFQLLSDEAMEDSDGVPQTVIEKGRDLWWGLILLVPRVAQGSEAQLGHPSRDLAGLAPGAVRSSHWIFRLGCWLHEESVLLWGDGISSGDQWRGPSVSASPQGPEDSGSSRSSSLAISMLAISSSSWQISSSSSWQISSSRWASSSSTW